MKATRQGDEMISRPSWAFAALRDSDPPGLIARGRKTYLCEFGPHLSEENLRALYRHATDPEVCHFNGFPPLEASLAQFGQEMRHQARRHEVRHQVFVILDEEKRLIGTIEYHDYHPRRRQAWLGIVLGEKDCWGKGYGRDAVRAFLGYLFQAMGLKKVRLRTYGFNVRARRCFEKCGFRAVGSAPWFDGLEDTLMEVTQEEFAQLVEGW
ncbi:MAG: GNAT family N-acetyltransferase [Deinococcus sp.]|nr:GNAT family N-acetyltransferase [Deinococcus sp.]